MKLHIDKAVYGGSCLATIPDGEGPHTGKKLFVPFTLPGEWVETSVARDEGSYALGQLVQVLKPVIGRTTPVCPYFGRCGGCQYQHATDTQQLDLKGAILSETLTRAGVQDLPPITPVCAASYGYRNRIRLHVETAGGFRLGYHQPKSNALLSVEECPIAAPVLQRALRALQKLGNEGLFPATATQVELFTDAAQTSMLLSLFVSASSQTGHEFSRLHRQLKASVPELRGAGIYHFPRQSVRRRTPQPSPRLLDSEGDQFLSYTAAGFEYRVSSGSFFQVNRLLIDALVDLVLRHATHGAENKSLAWDLYAGVGLFARPLTDFFDEVYAVEIAPSSFADLRENLFSTRAKSVASTTLDFLRNEGRRRPRKLPDLVLVDPPRAGLGPEVTGLLAEIAAPRFIYISCDPTTFARDLRALIQSGYTARHMYMVDLFPQTFHLETLVILERR